MGPERAKQTIKEALAKGADRGAGERQGRLESEDGVELHEWAGLRLVSEGFLPWSRAMSM